MKARFEVRRRLRLGILAPAGLALAVLAAGCSSGWVEQVRTKDLQRQANEFAAEEAPMLPEPIMAGAAQADWDDAAGEGDGAAVSPQQATTARQLIFRADLRLRVEDPRAVMDDARRFVETRGGFVESANVREYGDGAHADFVLRVPQAAFQDTLASLREAADEVLGDDSARQDVTAQHADLRARLENLEAAEAELREIMSMVRESGGDTEDVLDIFREVTRTRGEIDGLRAQLDALSEQVALSRIAVTLEPPPVAASTVAERWRPGETFARARADLVRAMQGLTDSVIYFTVAMLPPLVVGVALVWVAVQAVRWVRRRLPGRGD